MTDNDDDTDMETSVLEDLGAEVTSIALPVSICMMLCVALVRILNGDGKSGGSSVIIAEAVYSENDDDSSGTKLKGSLLNALIFVVVITAMTFVIVLLFKYGCVKIIYGYMGFATFMIFFFMTGGIVIDLLQIADIHLDAISLVFLLVNFAAVGSTILFFTPAPLALKQTYLTWTGVVVAFVFTFIPAWTTWVLLAAMALYDLYAVLTPHGPLQMLINAAIERQEDIPALVYEAREVRRPRRRRENATANSSSNNNTNNTGTSGPSTGAAANADEDRATVAAATPAADFAQAVGAPGVAEGSTDVSAGRAGPVAEAHGHDVDGGQAHLNAPLLEHRSQRRGSERRSTSPATEIELTAGTEVDEVSVRGSEPAGPVSESNSEAGVEQPLVAPQHDSERLQAAAEVTPASHGRQSQSTAGGAEGSTTTEQQQQQEQRRLRRRELEHHEEDEDDPYGLGIPAAVKLGLGDFIFYSVLVGRASMYDWMTVYSTFISVLSGLGITLWLLAATKKALPALPFSIFLGIAFYFLTRLALEPFVVPAFLSQVFW